MNKTKIEWTDYSWNPITGCKHGCWYCYARKLSLRFKKIFPYGFEPHFYPERLKEPWELKKPSKIFVCSIADLFASWTKREWTRQVLNSMFHCPTKHSFQLLTKNPENILTITEFRQWFPKNWWFGTTVTGENGDERNIDEIKKIPLSSLRYVSFEPLLNYIDCHKHCLGGLDWIIIGKLTGSRKVKLQWEWVAEILREAKYHDIPVFMKENLGCSDPIQEFPEEKEFWLG